MQDAHCLLHVKSNLRDLIAASLYWNTLQWHDLAEPIFPATIPFYASAGDCARVRVGARVVEFELDTATYLSQCSNTTPTRLCEFLGKRTVTGHDVHDMRSFDGDFRTVVEAGIRKHFGSACIPNACASRDLPAILPRYLDFDVQLEIVREKFDLSPNEVPMGVEAVLPKRPLFKRMDRVLQVRENQCKHQFRSRYADYVRYSNYGMTSNEATSSAS